MATASISPAEVHGRPRARTGLRVRLSVGQGAEEWRVDHIDAGAFALRGCPLPSGGLVTATIAMSELLSVSIRVRAHAVSACAGIQFFTFVDAAPDLIALVLSVSPKYQSH